MCEISAEHASQAGNILSRIILDIYVVGLMDKAYGLISAMTNAIFSDDSRSTFASDPPCVD